MNLHAELLEARREVAELVWLREGWQPMDAEGQAIAATLQPRAPHWIWIALALVAVASLATAG